jgi:hypothetical protein
MTIKVSEIVNAIFYQWSKLFLLVGGQLGELVLSGLKLFRIVNEITNGEFVLASLKHKVLFSINYYNKLAM